MRIFTTLENDQNPIVFVVPIGDAHQTMPVNGLIKLVYQASLVTIPTEVKLRCTAFHNSRDTRKPAMAPAAKDPDPTSYSGRFAQRLRTLREKKKMTGQQLVQALNEAGSNVGQTTYYNWESGRSEPPLDVLPVLAKTLGLSGPRLLFPAE